MLGAVIGDIAGSRFEFDNYKSKDFEFFTDKCRFTDDTVMTCAIAEAILESAPPYDDLPEKTVDAMRRIGQPYPYCGYGGRFRKWMYYDKDPKPYGSFGNGSAMRVSPAGWAGSTLAEVKRIAKLVTEVTHNSAEGLKGAEAVAAAVFLARTGTDIKKIREYMEKNYYRLDFTIDGIRDSYGWDETCQGSVPQAIEAFLESRNFEDAVRNAVSLGGDSDTIAAIAGGIAGAYYGVPEKIRERALAYLDGRLLAILNSFEKRFCGGK